MIQKHFFRFVCVTFCPSERKENLGKGSTKLLYYSLRTVVVAFENIYTFSP